MNKSAALSISGLMTIPAAPVSKSVEILNLMNLTDQLSEECFNLVVSSSFERRSFTDLIELLQIEQVFF